MRVVLVVKKKKRAVFTFRSSHVGDKQAVFTRFETCTSRQHVCVGTNMTCSFELGAASSVGGRRRIEGGLGGRTRPLSCPDGAWSWRTE